MLMKQSQLDELVLEGLNRTWRDMGIEEADFIDEDGFELDERLIDVETSADRYLDSRKALS